MTLEQGTLLHNRYRVHEVLGKGGMGAVYRAIDESLGVEVALKENFVTDEEYARQFRREAVILANLRHANMPRVTDHFVIEGQGQYLVMDYIEGEDLKERINSERTIIQDEVIVMGVAMCDALDYLHSRQPPILHRDIKPGNIKVTPQGQVFLVDFGLAKISIAGQETTTGARGMTPGYSPPEQYGTARTDSRSDIYALGATLYSALTGTVPEDAFTRAMRQTELTQVRTRNPKITRSLATVVERAMQVEPQDRYQSAAEFKEALLEVNQATRARVTDQGLMVTPPGAPTARRGRSKAKTARSGAGGRGCGIWVWVVAGALLVVGVIAGALILPGLLGGDDPTPKPPRVAQTSVPGSDATLPAFTASPEIVNTLPPEMTLTFTPGITSTFTPTLTPTLAATPLGGGNGQIAFASDRTGIPQIWAVNADGSGLRQVTDLPDGACQPDWSPDGTRLVFISPCTENQTRYPGASLQLINADGGGWTPLPSHPAGDYDPEWSPDGSQILFTTLRESSRPQIYALNVSDNSVEAISNSLAVDFQPAWSPDGTRIVFVTTRITGFAEIWVMDSNGGNQDYVWRGESRMENTSPTWSQDGQFILFTQDRNGFPWLMTIAVDGSGDAFPLTSNTDTMREGDYSPDGSWVVFESWPEGNHDIYIMTASGLRVTFLAGDASRDFDPAWGSRGP